jgi:hypothetical protein
MEGSREEHIYVLKVKKYSPPSHLPQAHLEETRYSVEFWGGMTL